MQGFVWLGWMYGGAVFPPSTVAPGGSLQSCTTRILRISENFANCLKLRVQDLGFGV